MENKIMNDYFLESETKTIAKKILNIIASQLEEYKKNNLYPHHYFETLLMNVCINVTAKICLSIAENNTSPSLLAELSKEIAKKIYDSTLEAIDFNIGMNDAKQQN